MRALRSGIMSGGTADGVSTEGLQWTTLPRPPCGIFVEAQLGYPAERIARALDAYADEDGQDG